MPRWLVTTLGTCGAWWSRGSIPWDRARRIRQTTDEMDRVLSKYDNKKAESDA